MKIYIDYIFLINFIFDFIILNGINIILKRNVKLNRILIGSFAGAFSIFILFINIPNIMFTLLKILFGILMVIISFSFKNIKYTLNNFIYLMILSIVIGGFLYMCNIEVGYEHVGMVFIKNNDGLNMLILILITILVVLIYQKQTKILKKEISSSYDVILYIGNKKYKLKGFLDTGNNLSFYNKPVYILNKGIKINFNKCKFVYVPYKTIDNNSIIKCFIIDKIFISQIGYKYNCLVGISNDKFCLDDKDIILNRKIMEDI